MFRFLLMFMLIFSGVSTGFVNSVAEEGTFEESDIGEMDIGVLVLNLKQEVDKIQNVSLQNVDLKQEVEHIIHGKKCECEKGSKDCKCPDEMHDQSKMKQDSK